MATDQGLNVQRRKKPAYIVCLQKYCLLRWTRAQTAARSARWFAAADRCARLHRLAVR
jgi:hypothetical protein